MSGMQPHRLAFSLPYKERVRVESQKHKCLVSYPRFGMDQSICIFPRGNYFLKVFRFFEIRSHRCFTLIALRYPSSGV